VENVSARWLSLAAVLVLVLPSFSVFGYETLFVPTEVRYNDPSRAFDGYTMFPSRGFTYLLDMEGRVVHTWNRGSNPKLLDNGNILDRGSYDILGGAGFQEVDWNSTVVWQYTETRRDYSPHHDFNRIFNTKLNAWTTIYIAQKNITSAQALAAGADPSTGPYNGAQMDVLVEVAMNGTVVWEWWFFDHVVQDIDPAKPNYVGDGKNISDYPGRININMPGRPLRADWLHCNALDYNQKLDQIVVSSLYGEFYVVDHGATFVANDPAASLALARGPKGDFLYRFGDPARYGRGVPPSILEDWTRSSTGTKQLGGAHDIQWIRDGLPGAGHFLLFNNAQYLYERTPQSYVVEINPYLDSDGRDTGHYVDPPSAGYRLVEPFDPKNTSKQARLISNQTVWMYGARSNQDLYDQIGCSVQRLGNGNTLICSCAHGRIIEATAKGDIVWEYVNPDSVLGLQKVRSDSLPMVSAMFRAYRIGPGHPALAGRTLTPGNPLTGPVLGPDFRPPEGATETFFLNASASCEGYTLFSAFGKAYLIDLEGRVVNSWSAGAVPRLLDNGTLLAAAYTDLEDLREIRMLGWDGSVLWKYQETRPGYLMHHDFLVGRNKELGADTLMYLASRPVTAREALAAGCDPADGPYDDARTDGVVEVDMNGTVAWEWWFFDHGIQDVDPSKANHVGAGRNISVYPGRINLNLPGRPVGKSWLSANSIDYNGKLDQVVINSGLGEFYIIDHEATFVPGDPASSRALAAGPAGDFLYRFGDPARYGRGAPPSVGADWTTSTTGEKQLGGSSAVHWIDAGLPGEGHLLVFNNGQYYFGRTARSYVFEVDPFRNASGGDEKQYVDPPDAGYRNSTLPMDENTKPKLLSNQVVWYYHSSSPLAFFSHLGSGARRLQNGNTLVCAMTEGHIFEVGKDGKVAWEYINPVTADGAVGRMCDNYPMTNPVYRALRYGPGSHALRGQNITPGRTITGAPSHYITPEQIGTAGLLPSLSGTAHAPARPGPSDAVTVATRVKRIPGVASVMLTYSTLEASAGGRTAAAPVNAPMYDDGLHGDGRPGDWTFGASIPAFPAGTRVDYYAVVTATGGLSASDPPGAPGAVFSYTVAGGDPPRTKGNLPDTGQAGDYTAEYGEDSDYTINAPAFADNGDGTVADKVTGLTWQKTDGGEMTWEAALAYAESLKLGGRGDWRLPTGAELFDILDFGRRDAPADPAFFPASPAGGWWSGETLAGDPSMVWAVGAGGCLGPLPRNGTAGGGSPRLGVRCVRANVAGLQGGAFTDNGDGTVTSAATGLVWQKTESPSELAWEQALARCEALVLGGRDDWRLPNVKELLSLSNASLSGPSLDASAFIGARPAGYWTSTTVADDPSAAWHVDFELGAASAVPKGRSMHVRAVRGGSNATGGNPAVPVMVPVAGGTFVMGDHSGLGNATDELPLHAVSLDGFSIGRYEVTNAEFCVFLNDAMADGSVTVASGAVLSRDGALEYCDLYKTGGASRIAWDGARFSVAEGRMSHPATGVRWEGAAAYCNWLGDREGFPALYDVATGRWTATATGYRLPTEAEWEWAALGGRNDSYPMFPWGDHPDSSRANLPGSGDPYEDGRLPATTPAGFYDGGLRQRADFGWPGGQGSYNTGNGSNALGLQDLAGNVLEWVHDLYGADYYSSSPAANPSGPAGGTLMPDGRAHHALRGGSWLSSEYGFTRIADRMSGYERGPKDTDCAYGDVGFRVVLGAARSTGEPSGPGASAAYLAGSGRPADGPAADAAGNVYFTDPAAGTIYVWSAEGGLSVFRNGTGGARGLAFDSDGTLVACEADYRRVARYDTGRPAQGAAVLASTVDGEPFTGPDDLWVDPLGGIYFTDPPAAGGTSGSEGRSVLYLAPGAPAPVPVASGLLRPGGIAGTADGRALYVSDAGAGLTYRYAVLAGGSLSGRELFVPKGAEGLTLDALGNVYLANESVLVFAGNGALLERITVPARPTNLEFGGKDRRTLYITAVDGLYGILRDVPGTSNFKPRVVINEIKVVSGSGSWVELFNMGAGPADVGGMYLTNELSRPAAWMIPDGTAIGAGGFLVIGVGSGGAGGPLHAPFGLDAAGGVVALFMPNGLTLVDALRFGPLPENGSWGRYPDGAGDLTAMHDHPSPGAPNAPDDPAGGGGAGGGEPDGDAQGGGKPSTGGHAGGNPEAVTLAGPSGVHIILAVLGSIAAVVAGLFVFDRRPDRTGPAPGRGKQQD
jgi:gluconolactonase